MYIWTVSSAWTAFMLSSIIAEKENKVKRKRASWRIGICKSKMVLSTYMHSLDWTGYLRKIGCEPITTSCKFHKLGIKGMLIMHALTTNSVAIVMGRAENSVLFPKSFYKTQFDANSQNKNDFVINLENIGVFDEFSTRQTQKFLSTRIEPANCFMTESVPVSTTVKNVLGTIMANHSVGIPRDEGFHFYLKKLSLQWTIVQLIVFAMIRNSLLEK